MAHLNFTIPQTTTTMATKMSNKIDRSDFFANNFTCSSNVNDYLLTS